LRRIRLEEAAQTESRQAFEDGRRLFLSNNAAETGPEEGK
jgi:hypothetical protein